MVNKREAFGSRLAVIFAMAGSAIGLGNIWRFPYMIGEHGGSTFVLLYIISTLLVSLPVFISEVVIGRRSRCNAKDAMASLSGGNSFWKKVGFLPILIPTIITSYYSVIGGWSLEFFFKACSLDFIRESPESVGGIFGDFVSGTWTPVIMHMVFLLLCVIVVVGGVKSGIEKFSKATLPVLFVLIVAIAVYSLCLPGSGEGMKYLFKLDFSQFTPRTFAYAMGQSFYSLSLGMGIIITYGSYIKKEENLIVSSAGTAVSDLFFALLAGVAIMPAVFAAGLEPGAGPGLIFQSIPYIFTKMGVSVPFISAVVSIIFFLTIIVAAMTSCVSLIEVGVAYLVEKFNLRRGLACAILFAICGGLGIFCSLSFGPMKDVLIFDRTLFDFFDWLASNILLLVMAFLAVVFVGFVLRKEAFADELSNGGTLKVNKALVSTLFFLIKWVAPVAVVLIFITNFIL